MANPVTLRAVPFIGMARGGAVSGHKPVGV